jgi:hypothetical protein
MTMIYMEHIVQKATQGLNTYESTCELHMNSPFCEFSILLLVHQNKCHRGEICTILIEHVTKEVLQRLNSVLDAFLLL